MNSKQAAARLLKWVHMFPGVPVLVVGDLMVDRSCRGPAERISPEAPVPVVHVLEDSSTPGGAGNVAGNLAVLGARPSLLSICGEDKTGEDIQRELEHRRIDISGVFVDPDRPTITKTRIFAGHQQVARFDFEKRGDLSAGIHRKIIDQLKAAIPRQKCVIISDYGKGVVTPAVIKTALAEARRAGIPVIVDPKIEHFTQYRGVDSITPNAKEAVEGFRAYPPKTEEQFLELGRKILSRLKCRSLLITRGEKGMTLFEKSCAPQTIPTVAQEVYDVTGAGDTVVSVFSLARAVGAPHLEAAKIANCAAGVVVAKVGTAVVTREELAGRLRRL